MSNTDSFQAFYDQTKPRFEKHLKAVMKLQQLQPASELKVYAGLLKEVTTLIGRGGKRLRPILYQLAYEGYGGRRTSAALEVAVSLELLHAFLLMHDDIIDRDNQRWGGQNIIGVYFDAYSRNLPPREALHAAESYGILAGDMCIGLAHERLASCGFDPDIIKAMQLLLSQTLQQVIAGELSDVAMSHAKNLPLEADILKMYQAKTASYSFRLPLLLGALSAGTYNAEQLKLGTIADTLGVVYQLQDDVLGVFGASKNTGKSEFSDIREGKRSLLIVKALELATPSARRQLQSLLGSNTLTADSALTAQKIISNSGALAYVDVLIKQYITTATTAMQTTALSPTHQHYLMELAEQLVDRRR